MYVYVVPSETFQNQESHKIHIHTYIHTYIHNTHTSTASPSPSSHRSVPKSGVPRPVSAMATSSKWA